jgi:serine/threonine-protein kinase HipA
MSVPVVNVWFDHFNYHLKVGRLAYDNKTIYFEYDPTFLEHGIELSPYKLPLRSGVVVPEDRVFEGLFGLFADSLPDGWGRLLIDRYLMEKGTAFHMITPLDRLMMIGEYGVGALRYEPVTQTVEEHSGINLDHLATESLAVLKGVDEQNIETLLAHNGSSAGARPKIMIQLNHENQIIAGNQALQEGYEHYMVKFAGRYDHHESGKLEYLYALMAKDADITISEAKLLQGKENSYFATKRFDRVGNMRRHIHSLAGLVHSDFRLPSVDYDDILAATFDLTKDMQEVKKVYRLAVFNLLVHNRDDHVKNFSFMLDEHNHWKFAPAYDLTFSFGAGGEHSTTYMGVGKNPTKKELLVLAKNHMIKDALVIIEEVYNVVTQFQVYAQRVDLSQRYTKEIMKQLPSLT